MCHRNSDIELSPLLAQGHLSLTASLRFDGALNVDVTECQTTFGALPTHSLLWCRKMLPSRWPTVQAMRTIQFLDLSQTGFRNDLRAPSIAVGTERYHCLRMPFLSLLIVNEASEIRNTSLQQHQLRCGSLQRRVCRHHVAVPGGTAMFHGVVERMAMIIEKTSSHLEACSLSAPNASLFCQSFIATEASGNPPHSFVTRGFQSASFVRQRRNPGGTTMFEGERDRRIPAKVE